MDDFNRQKQCSKILKSTNPTSKALPPIVEKKPFGLHSSNNVIKCNVPKGPNRILRRRSRSVPDLRAVHPKSKVGEKTFGKPSFKKINTQKENEENKPKITKNKIPSWDYKSRFNDLQLKYSAVEEELKHLKVKLITLPELEEQNNNLRAETKAQAEKLEFYQRNEIILNEEKLGLTAENCLLKNDLLEKENAYLNLKNMYDSLLNKNMQTCEKLKDTENLLQKSYIALSHLEKQSEKLEILNLQLKQNLEDNEDQRRSLHNTIQDMKGNIRVFCRVRPPVTRYEHEKQLCSIFFPNESSLEIKKFRESVSTISGRVGDLKQEFSFDKVFPPEANQAEVFEELSQLVQSALDGYHVCVFAYGQTGSGKTYTMQGSPYDYGMVPRTIDLIFKKIEKLSVSDWTYTVAASFLEIYNENIRDLLVPNSAHNYELRYNEGRGVTVTNLQIIPINSSRDLKDLMEEAHKNRVVAATDFNEHSSRSHAVTKIYLEGYNKMTNAKYSGSINLVDLAGSETARTTVAERLNETKNINKSLSTLGNVMLALHNKDPHVPYRNSKLTFLLQSCLGGNSKTLMIVNISPFEECFNESVNSLRFASKVKDIKTIAKKNKTYAFLQPKI